MNRKTDCAHQMLSFCSHCEGYHWFQASGEPAGKPLWQVFEEEGIPGQMTIEDAIDG